MGSGSNNSGGGGATQASTRSAVLRRCATLTRRPSTSTWPDSTRALMRVRETSGSRALNQISRRVPDSEAATESVRRRTGRAVAWARASFSLRTGPENAQGEQRHAHADGRVGHVEGWPVMGAPVEVEEVHDGPEPTPVDEIADGATEDEPQGEPGHPAPGGEQPDPDHGEHRQGSRREQAHDPPPGGRRGGEHAEGEPGVHDQ